MPTIGYRGLKESPFCAQCPCAHNGKPRRAVPGFGGTEGLCIIGEAPGGNELEQGYPMIGPTGKIVNKALAQAGADRGLVFATNALLCRRPSDDDAMLQAIDCCRPRLQADLAHARPTTICALGGTAMKALQLPVYAVSLARGTIQESPLFPGIPIIGALHPAALFKGGAGEMGGGGKQKMNVDAQAMFLFSDIAKACKIASGAVSPTWSDDIEVVHEASKVADALNAILNDIYAEGILGFDLEWVCPGFKNALHALGANVHLAQITWVGIGCSKRAVSFKWEALIESGELAYLQSVMEDETLIKLAHNKQADRAIWEAQVGPIAGRFLDSMLAHHCACPGIDHDLQQVASQYLCIPPWKVEHAKAIAAYKEAERAAVKVEQARVKEIAKAERKAAHEVKNAEAARQKAERKAKSKADHEARNAASKADKEARKKRSRGRCVVDGNGEITPGERNVVSEADNKVQERERCGCGARNGRPDSMVAPQLTFDWRIC